MLIKFSTMNTFPDHQESDLSDSLTELSSMEAMSSIPCAAFLLEEFLSDTPVPYVNEHEQEEILHPDYKPTMYDVTCGRGKGYYNKPGNKRYRSIISQYVDSYRTSHSRIQKSLILQQIIDQVQQQDNGHAQFLKFDFNSNCWYRMSLDDTREKVGHTMRRLCSQSDTQERRQARLKIIRKINEASAAK